MKITSILLAFISAAATASFDLDTISVKNEELVAQYKLEKDEKDTQQQLLLTRLPDYLNKHKDKIEYRPFGFPFSYEPIYVLDNMVFETQIGSVQIFKEGYLPKLFEQFQGRFQTFEEIKHSSSELSEYAELITSFHENQITSFLFDKHAELRFFFEKIKRNTSTQQKLISEVNRNRWHNSKLLELKEEKEAINHFLETFDQLEEKENKEREEYLRQVKEEAKAAKAKTKEIAEADEKSNK